MNVIQNFLIFVGAVTLLTVAPARGEVSMKSLLQEMVNFDSVASRPPPEAAFLPLPSLADAMKAKSESIAPQKL